jgi:outer membrane protein assembly factor BamB
MKHMLSLAFGICLCLAVRAQNRDSLWTSSSMKSEIEWLTLASDGTLLSSNTQIRDGATNANDVYTILTGIDAQTGKVKWKYPASSSPSSQRIDGVDFVPNTPFIKLRNVPLTVIDPYDGHIIVDIAAEGITQEEAHGYLLESGHLWVSGTFNGNRCISLFDLGTGKKLWSNSDFLKEKNKAASKLSKLSAMTGSSLPNKEPIKLLCNPINHGADKMIVATSNGVFDVQISSGQVAWEADLPDPNKGKMIKVEVNTNFMRLIPGRDKFYVVKAAYITACSYTDGRPVWANPVKTSGPIDQIIYDEKGLILCPGSSNTSGMLSSGFMKMVNEKTGAELWGDGIKFNGGIKTYMYTDKGLAIVMVNTEDKNSINFIDVAAGKFALSKNVNVDGNVQYLEVVPKGLLFKTDRAINILDLTTGSSVLNLPVQGKKDRAIVSANAGDRYYFYSDADQNVYEINKSAGTSKQLNSNKIEFKGGEVPEFIEARVGGVSLSSAQNVMLIGFDGTTKFNVYNPGVRTVAAALQNVNNALDMLNNITGAASASTQLSALTGSSSRNNYDRMNQAFASTGNASYILNMKQFGSIHNRAKASAKSNENVFMMTKVNDRSTLVGINKDTGEMKSTIPLARRDDNPMYQVDALSGLLFYAPKGKNLIGWSTSANAVSCFVTAGK